MNSLAEHFGLDLNDLTDILYKTNGFIAGGSAISVYYNKNIEDDSDLDIFVRIPAKYNEYTCLSLYTPHEKLLQEQYCNFLAKYGYTHTTYTNHTIYKNNLNEDINEIEYHKCAFSHFIKNITNYTKNNKKIQIIIIYNCTIEEFVEMIDLNICRLVLFSNGKIIYFYHKHSNYLSNNELYMIYKKNMYVINPLYPANLEKRINKYLKRRFIWIDLETEIPLFDGRPTNVEVSCYVFTEYNNHIIDYDEFINNKKIKENPNEIIADSVKSSKSITDHNTGVYRYYKYYSDYNTHISNTLTQYLNNLDCCINNFFKMLETIKILQFILSEYEFINSDIFNDNNL